MMKSKITLKNIYAYIQGNSRYYIYYKLPWLKWIIPSYIWKQIEMRMIMMDEECYNDGQCKICGCKTTALQFANKMCDKPCYPPMLPKNKFHSFIFDYNNEGVNYKGHNYKLVCHKINRYSVYNYKFYVDDKLVHIGKHRGTLVEKLIGD